MDPWRNPYNHVAEFMIGVPYFYNKFTCVKYKQKGTNKQLVVKHSNYQGVTKLQKAIRRSTSK